MGASLTSHLRDSSRSHKLVFAIRRSLTSCHHDMPQGGEAICTNCSIPNEEDCFGQPAKELRDKATMGRLSQKRRVGKGKERSRLVTANIQTLATLQAHNFKSLSIYAIIHVNNSPPAPPGNGSINTYQRAVHQI